jgi:hypothetical protein
LVAGSRYQGLGIGFSTCMSEKLDVLTGAKGVAHFPGEFLILITKIILSQVQKPGISNGKAYHSPFTIHLLIPNPLIP